MAARPGKPTGLPTIPESPSSPRATVGDIKTLHCTVIAKNGIPAKAGDAPASNLEHGKVEKMEITPGKTLGDGGGHGSAVRAGRRFCRPEAAGAGELFLFRQRPRISADCKSQQAVP